MTVGVHQTGASVTGVTQVLSLGSRLRAGTGSAGAPAPTMFNYGLNVQGGMTQKFVSPCLGSLTSLMPFLDVVKWTLQDALESVYEWPPEVCVAPPVQVSAATETMSLYLTTPSFT